MSGVIGIEVIEPTEEIEERDGARDRLITGLGALAARLIPIRTRPAATTVPVSAKIATPAAGTIENGTETVVTVVTVVTVAIAGAAIWTTDLPDVTCLTIEAGAAAAKNDTIVTGVTVATEENGREALRPHSARNLHLT